MPVRRIQFLTGCRAQIPDSIFTPNGCNALNYTRWPFLHVGSPHHCGEFVAWCTKLVLPDSASGSEVKPALLNHFTSEPGQCLSTVLTRSYMLGNGTSFIIPRSSTLPQCCVLNLCTTVPVQRMSTLPQCFALCNRAIAEIVIKILDTDDFCQGRDLSVSISMNDGASENFARLFVTT